MSQQAAQTRFTNVSMAVLMTHATSWRITASAQVSARDLLLDHIWADALSALRSLGHAPDTQMQPPGSPRASSQPTSPSAAAAAACGGASQGGGSAEGLVQDWGAGASHGRCRRCVAELKAAVASYQVRCGHHIVSCERFEEGRDATQLAWECQHHLCASHHVSTMRRQRVLGCQPHTSAEGYCASGY